VTPVVRFGGCGIAFMRGLEAVLPPLAVAPVLDVLKQPSPPEFCPCCAMPALAPVRDSRGEWTWNCFGGCNP
jgi:hypothetical protein